MASLPLTGNRLDEICLQRVVGRDYRNIEHNTHPNCTGATTLLLSGVALCIADARHPTWKPPRGPYPPEKGGSLPPPSPVAVQKPARQKHPGRAVAGWPAPPAGHLRLPLWPAALPHAAATSSHCLLPVCVRAAAVTDSNIRLVLH